MPKALRSLINSGISVLRPSNGVGQRTIVVLGVARGGTSMIAGLLHRMGVFMGSRLDSIVYEDMEISTVIESGDTVALERILSDRNARYDVWGWKRPAVINYLGAIHGSLRHPHYIAVFRDIAAIAMRNQLSVQSPEFENMKQSLDHQRKIISFIESVDAPVMLVSYEKALLNGDALVASLADFAGVSTDAIPDDLASEFIKVNIPEYLDATRSNRVIGRVDRVTQTVIRGWALQRGNELPVTVRLIVNGKTVATQCADQHRRNLAEKGLHPTGHCGFVFRLKENTALKRGDSVRIRVKGDVKDLSGIPPRFRP